MAHLRYCGQHLNPSEKGHVFSWRWRHGLSYNRINEKREGARINRLDLSRLFRRSGAGAAGLHHDVCAGADASPGAGSVRAGEPPKGEVPEADTVWTPGQGDYVQVYRTGEGKPITVCVTRAVYKSIPKRSRACSPIREHCFYSFAFDGQTVTRKCKEPKRK